MIESAPMRVNVRGRVVRSRLHDGVRYTAVMTPAPDLYSRPNMVEVRSKSQIGGVDEDVNVWCTLGGFGEKPRKWVDRETGESRTIYNMRLYLDLIE